MQCPFLFVRRSSTTFVVKLFLKKIGNNGDRVHLNIITEIPVYNGEKLTIWVYCSSNIMFQSSIILQCAILAQYRKYFSNIGPEAIRVKSQFLSKMGLSRKQACGDGIRAKFV